MSATPNMSATTDSVARANHPLRPISFGTPAVHVERRADGTIYLRPKAQLHDYPVRITDRLHHWAAAAPDRVFMAERNAARGWRKITYAELLTSSRHIASALLARGLSAEKPVVILSGNSVDHALIAFGALYAGIPFCPVSPAYSLVSRDYGKLSYLIKLLTPGLVFADDATKFADALAANVSSGTEITASHGAVAGRDVTTLADLMAAPLHSHLDAVHDAIGPDTIAKFLLTSGSTGNPKAVINTQRMICANQVMLRDTLAFLKARPWPGNVRELRTAIEHAVVLCKSDRITPRDLPPSARNAGGIPGRAAAAKPAANDLSVHEAEKQLIIRALKETNGNRTLAAKKLGLSRRTLYRKLAEYGLGDL